MPLYSVGCKIQKKKKKYKFIFHINKVNLFMITSAHETPNYHRQNRNVSSNNSVSISDEGKKKATTTFIIILQYIFVRWQNMDFFPCKMCSFFVVAIMGLHYDDYIEIMSFERIFHAAKCGCIHILSSEPQDKINEIHIDATVEKKKQKQKR